MFEGLFLPENKDVWNTRVFNIKLPHSVNGLHDNFNKTWHAAYMQ